MLQKRTGHIANGCKKIGSETEDPIWVAVPPETPQLAKVTEWSTGIVGRFCIDWSPGCEVIEIDYAAKTEQELDQLLEEEGVEVCK